MVKATSHDMSSQILLALARLLKSCELAKFALIDFLAEFLALTLMVTTIYLNLSQELFLFITRTFSWFTEYIRFS